MQAVVGIAGPRVSFELEFIGAAVVAFILYAAGPAGGDGVPDDLVDLGWEVEQTDAIGHV